MPRYVIERLIEPETFHLGPRLSQKAIRLINEQYPELVWLHSHIVESDGEGLVRAFCVYESPNEELLRQHNEAIGGITIVNVYPIAGDVAPEDIPPEGERTAERYFS